MAGVIPTCLALVLCNEVKRDNRTGSPSIMGALDVLDVASFPATTQPFAVWMQLGNGNGRVAMRLIIEYVPPGRLEPEVVLVVPFSLTFSDPNEAVAHAAMFDDGINLERMGRYRVTLTTHGTTIMHRYFVVRHRS